MTFEFNDKLQWPGEKVKRQVRQRRNRTELYCVTIPDFWQRSDHQDRQQNGKIWKLVFQAE